MHNINVFLDEEKYKEDLLKKEEKEKMFLVKNYSINDILCAIDEVLHKIANNFLVVLVSLNNRIVSKNLTI